MTTIPVIDFQKYGLDVNNPETVPRKDLTELGNQMCRALETIGFCYLKNHGVPEKQVLIRTVMLKTHFLSQSYEIKIFLYAFWGFCRGHA